MTREEYIGLTLEEARKLANENKRPHRVVEVDGTSMIVTSDLVIDRINFQVKENKIVSVYNG
jgi:hypothetical protein